MIVILPVSFSVFIGVALGIFEFFMDYFFGLNMQKSGLVDTMTDLIVNTVGALVVGIAGFLYLKNPKPGITQNIIEYLVKKRNLKIKP